MYRCFCKYHYLFLIASQGGDLILKIAYRSYRAYVIVNCNLHTGTMLRRLIDLKKDGMDIRNVHNFRILQYCCMNGKQYDIL